MHRLPILGLAGLLSAGALAGCGSSGHQSTAHSSPRAAAPSSAGAVPAPGSYAGTTSQHEPISFVVGPGGQVSGLAVKLHYACPQGASESDSQPSGPTAPVALAGGALQASWVSQGTNHFTIAGHVSGGSFSGTLSGHNPYQFLGSQSGSGAAMCTSGPVSWTASPAVGAPTGGAATTAGPVARQLDAATATYNQALAATKGRVEADLRSGSLTGFQADVARLRTSLFEFDAQARKLAFPSSVATQLNTVLGDDRTEIADLDAVGQAGSLSDATTRFERAAGDNDRTRSAVRALRAAV